MRDLISFFIKLFKDFKKEKSTEYNIQSIVSIQIINNRD